MIHFWLQTCEMYGMMSMILKYSSSVMPYTVTTEKTILIETMDS